MATAENLLNISRGYIGSTDGDQFVREYNRLTGAGIPMGSFWCAMFVSVVARQAGLPETELPNFHGCTTGRRRFKELGRWRDKAGYVPKPGDVIIFDWDGNSSNGMDHTGFVENVVNGRVYTIEGNSGNRGICQKCSYALNSSLIAGYGTPLYEEVTKVAEKQQLIGEDKVRQLAAEEAEKAIKSYVAAQESLPVSGWAKTDWERMCSLGVLDGSVPRAAVSREQLAVVAGRLMALGGCK